MSSEYQDTIVAIATAPGQGGIGVVRLSGRDAHRIGRAICGKPLRMRRVGHARFRDAAGETLDRGLVLAFVAPASYTGEDVVELHAHGARVVLESLVARALELGARHARPGEFSERAFVNGKLDLPQAEAIADLVAASSLQQARAAQRSLAGEFSREVAALLAQLIALRVHVEAAIDFPDEDVDFLADARIAEALAALRQGVARTLAAARLGQRVRDGLHVVIVGRPNAGKSSLLNALAGDERAIVTAIPGTTRDVLRETVAFDGIELTLVDTAGLRETDDAIEAEGVRRARDELARADLALVVLDATRGPALPDDHAELARELPNAAARIVLLNKSDLSSPHPATLVGTAETLAVSARTGSGIAALRDALRRHAGANEAGGTYSARARHVEALERAAQHLGEADTVLATTRAGELVAEELRQAQRALAEITGAYSSDDLLGAIFSTFCIGK